MVKVYLDHNLDKVDLYKCTLSKLVSMASDLDSQVGRRKNGEFGFGGCAHDGDIYKKIKKEENQL